ncbi:MAG TPA: DUF4185 domain-containing protein [Methylomirabilota bacterium]|nr:DUF4185 domain-containing protein [Methylomirabilota bacterium]
MTDLGTIKTNRRILARDGGSSALFQGYSIWLYGDTFLEKPDALGRGLISNTWSYTKDLDARDGIAGFRERTDSHRAPTMLVPETPEERAFNQAHDGETCREKPCGERWAIWPPAIVADPARNRALVFYMLVHAMPGAFNFQSVGASIAVLRDLQGPAQRSGHGPPLVEGHADLMFNQNDPNFGTTAFITDDILYVYGCGTPTKGGDQGCRLGRVAAGQALDRGAWRFYAGDGRWSSAITDAVSVFDGSSVASVWWNPFLQRYIALYCKAFSEDIVMRTAPAPEGPWSSETLLFRAMKPAEGNVYDAHAHPEYESGDRETIYVTYSRATAPFRSEVRLVAVRLRKQ